MLLVQYFKKFLENKYYEYEKVISRYHFKNFIESIDAREKELERITYNLNIHSPLKAIDNQLAKVEDYELRLKLLNLVKKIDEKITLINDKTNLITYYLNHKLTNLENAYNTIHTKMELVNPLNLLKKGYVLTYQNDKLITKAEDVIIDDELVLNYYDGKIISLPKKKVKKEN